VSATFSGQQSKLNLAGQRAAFTKALQAHGMTEDEGNTPTLRKPEETLLRISFTAILVFS